jgi:hypothetical protein
MAFEERNLAKAMFHHNKQFFPSSISKKGYGCK